MDNIKFTFKIRTHSLVFEGNSLGKESIYLNGSCIKFIRNFGFSSRHTIMIDDVEYELAFSVKNPFGTKCFCQLSTNGELIESKVITARLGENNKILSAVILLVSCGAIGLALPYLGDWIWLSPILFILAVAFSASFRGHIYDEEKIT